MGKETKLPINGFYQAGYKCIPCHATLKDTLNNIKDTWADIISLSGDKKFLEELFRYKNSAGIEFKDGNKENNSDLKLNFDFTQEELPRLESIAHRNGKKIVLKLIFWVKRLYEDIVPMMEKACTDLGMEYGIKLPEDWADKSSNQWMLRMNHYFGDVEAGQIVASPHTDRSYVTAHLCESQYGLEYLDIETRTWHRFPMTDRFISFFPAMQFQLLSGNKCKAICHRVVKDGASSEGRSSIVLFTQVKHVPSFPDGASRNEVPGFNYDMSYEELRKLFFKGR